MTEEQTHKIKKNAMNTETAVREGGDARRMETVSATQIDGEASRQREEAIDAETAQGDVPAESTSGGDLPRSVTFVAFLEQLKQPSAQHISRYLKK